MADIHSSSGRPMRRIAPARCSFLPVEELSDIAARIYWGTLTTGTLERLHVPSLFWPVVMRNVYFSSLNVVQCIICTATATTAQLNHVDVWKRAQKTVGLRAMMSVHEHRLSNLAWCC